MLKGIDPVLSPELLKVLCEMGHGDEIVIADANFTAESLGRGRLGPLENDASTLDVLGALDDDLHAERAIRALERHARRDLAPDSLASLRSIARKVLGVL